MLSRLRPLVASVYLFACVVLGCSDQRGWQDLSLDISGILVVAWALASRASERLNRPARQILLLVAVTVAFALFQVVELPDVLWLRVAPLTGGAAHHLTRQMSVAPDLSIRELLAIIPPLAIFCAIVRFGRTRVSALVIAFLAGTLLAVVVTLFAVAGQPGSPSHPLAGGNLGIQGPPFASRDRVAALFLTSLPFISAIPALDDRRNSDHRSGLLMISLGLGTVMMIAVVAVGTVVSYILAVPVIAGSVLVALPGQSVLRRPVALATTLLSVAAAAALTIIPPGGGETGHMPRSTAQARNMVLRSTAEVIGDHLPFGSGLGSFGQVSAPYSDAVGQHPTGMVHLNGHYAEVAVELGGPGIILMCLFLTWWAAALHSVWRNLPRRPFARAASVASAIILVQSLVDAPLRTTALAAVFAMCIALLATRPAPPHPQRPDLRPTRHLVVD